MKVRSAVRRLCAFCYVLKKKNTVYIRCKKVAKHKQRQGFHSNAGIAAGEGADAGTNKTMTIVPPSGELPAASHRTADLLGRLPWAPARASAASTVGPRQHASEVPALISTMLGQLVWLPLGGVKASSPLSALRSHGSLLGHRTREHFRFQ